MAEDDRYTGPATAVQQRIWLAEQLEPGTAAYHIPFALRLRGRLDPAALASAVQRVVDRHEALRTGLRVVDHEPRQVVAGAATARLAVVVLTARTDGPVLADALAAQAAAPFDLTDGPLLRTTLFRLAEDEHVLGVTVHHLVADQWSCGILVGDLAACYREVVNATPALRPAPPVQYLDYALWEHQQRAAGTWGHQLRYWRTQLADAPHLLELPADHPRPSARRFAGATTPLRLSAVCAKRVRAHASTAGTTPFVVLLAAFQVLLARYTGATDVVVGTAVANRTPQTEPVIGCFMNTVALRTSVAGDLSFTELVECVGRTVLAALEHQDVPFDMVVESLGRSADTSVSPVVQVMFTVQNAPLPVADLDGVTVTEEPVRRTNAHLDLSVHVIETAGTFEGFAEFSTELFEPKTIEMLVDRYRHLLEDLLDRPHTPVTRVPLGGLDERRSWLADASAPAWREPVRTLPARFEDLARSHPDELAVVDDTASLTYAELNRRANRLARHLVHLGAAPERHVAVFLPRTHEFLVATMAVLKSGAALVPIDAGTPPGRVASLLADVDPVLSLTDAAHVGSVLAPRTGLVLNLSSPDAASAALPATDLTDDERTPPQPDNAAYVLHTSGSTGSPKGVVVEHSSLGRYLANAAHQYPSLGEEALLHTSVSVDLSITSLFGPLWCGGTVRFGDLPSLAPTARDRVPGFVKLTPSHLSLLADTPDCWPTGHLVVGGETLLGGALAESRRLRPGVTIVNEYGPTEATVACADFVIGPDDPLPAGRVPIGRPSRGHRLYVLDPALVPVPAGVAGELYIAGDGLARGYLGRPGATGGRFVPDPFGPPGSRMYSSGDRVRRLPGGDLDYLGRLDDQVKIRGFRVEPGEVKAVLLRRPDLADAAVVATPDRSGRHTLVAYLVGANAGLDVDEVRRDLAASLPEHLVPTRLCVLDALPLGPSGKLDRTRLPGPAPVPRQRHREPSTDRERVLRDVFTETFGDVSVGVDDSLFDLGGDSIAAIQVVSRARARGIAVTVRQVLQCRTVAALAAVATDDARPIRLSDTATGPVPATPIMRWWLERGGSADDLHQSVTLTVPPALGVARLVAAMDTLLTHHDALRMRCDGPGLDLTVPPPDPAAASECVHHVLLGPDEAGSDKALAGLVDREIRAAVGRLDAARGRMIQAVWLDAGARPGRLVLVANHLVIDGVSWRTLVPDLVRCWQATAKGAEPRLDHGGPSFRAWAHRLTERATEPTTIAELDIWREILRVDEPALGARPLDPTADTAGTARNLTVTLSADQTRQVLTVLPDLCAADVDDVLLAALAAAVVVWRGEQPASTELLVDVERHGRDDTTATVGWLTALFPVRLDPGPLDRRDLVAGGASVDQVLKAIKHQLRSVPGDGSGFGLLKYLNGDTQLDGPPAQLCLNFHGSLTASEAAGWRLDSDPLGSYRAPGSPLTHVVSVDALVRNDQLVARWRWAAALLSEPAVTRLTRLWQAALDGFARRARSGVPGELTESDVSLVALRPGELARLADRYPGLRDVWPLTPVQEGMVFQGRYDRSPANGYVAQLAMDIEGPLDSVALRGAAKAMLRRHPNLRIAVVTRDHSRPVQVVCPPGEPEWSEIDLTGADEPHAAEAATRADRDRRFDLAEPAPLRFTLLRLGPRRFRFLFTNHHVVLDGWSVPLLMRELLSWYSAGDDAGLPPAVPYRDHVAWLATRDRDTAMSAWRSALSGLVAPTLVASDHAGARTRCVEHVDATLPDGVAELARAAGVTVTTVVQAAWALLLAGLTGRQDVVFGGTVSGRHPDLAGAADMIGLLINTVPVRVRFDPSEPLTGLLTRLQDEQAALVDHHHLGLMDIQRAAGRTRLFDTLVVVENYPIDPTVTAGRLGDLRVTGIEVNDAAHYPLCLVVLPGTTGRIRLDHRVDLVAGVAAAALADALRDTLVAMTRAPGKPLAALTMPGAELGAAMSAMSALAAPPVPDPVLGAASGGPSRTPTEELLSRIWAEVLEVPEPDSHHNFFELGGDSLLAMRVMDLVAVRCGVEIPVRALFEAPTIAKLARVVATETTIGAAGGPEPGVRIPRRSRQTVDAAVVAEMFDAPGGGARPGEEG